ncbi:chromosome partitioning protein [Micromonospora endolithica]|uniref:chromosome partitioning protein n=1 Tax=Micromonospora endolithica TaxID=230091 RepID=UPI003B511F27
MDENADRTHVPGQQPMPERDIEPPWPTEQGDAHPWAPAAGAPQLPPQQPGPPVPHHPVPPQSAAGRPPSAADYPSLAAGTSAPGGWAMIGPPGGGSGWTPAPAAGWAGPPSQGWAPPAPGLDGNPEQSATRPGPGRPGHDPADPPAPQWATGTTYPPAQPESGAYPPAQPESGAYPPAQPQQAGIPPATDAFGAPVHGGAVPAPRPSPPAAPVDLDQPFSLDQPAVAGTGTAVPQHAAPAEPHRPDGHPQAAGPPDDGDGAAPQATYDPTAGAGPDVPGDPTDGPATQVARVPTESPWAQPPQRPSAGEAAPPWAAAQAGALPVVPPPPVPPQPAAEIPPHGLEIPPVPQHTPEVPPQQEPAAERPGPFPPQPAWHPPPWQQGSAPQSGPVPTAYPPMEGVPPVPPGYPDQGWTPEVGAPPTAEDFARRRQVRPADPVATMGVRAIVNRTGLLRLSPGRHEQELRRDIEMVRRNFGGLRQVTVVNPKGGAGKTVAILLLAMTFGQKRGGYVLAWDNNETQGTLGMRAQQDFHSRTVRDMLRDLGQFHGAHGRVGDLSQYVRSQGEGMFDVLASDESATGGEMLTAAAFAEIREVVSRFYKLIFVDTGNNVRAQNWQAAMDATDQLVVTMSARNDSAETAARMLDHLEQSGRQRLVRQAVTVVSMPPSRKEIDLPAIQEHFAARTRAVLLAPYERLIDSGEPIRYGALSSATRDAWLKIAASVAEGL